jgi:polycomb protein EED
MFWDLERFTTYSRYMASLKDTQRDRSSATMEKPSWLLVKKNKKPDNASNLRNITAADKESMVSASPDPESVTTLGFNQKTLSEWAEMYDTSNAHGMVKPHRVGQVDGAFVGRQVGWSPEGDWCVVVGSQNRALIYQRWAKDNKGSTPGAN